MSTGNGAMTLAITLEALQSLSDPEEAVRDARRWSRHVGVVSNRAYAATVYANERRIPQDFFYPEYDVRASLAAARTEHPADRYVLVGTTERDRGIATEVGWEYRPIEEAAEKAGWEMVDGSGGSEGLVSRLSRAISRVIDRHG